MYLRMAAGNEHLPCDYAYIEFSTQSSIPLALQNSDSLDFMDRTLRYSYFYAISFCDAIFSHLFETFRWNCFFPVKREKIGAIYQLSTSRLWINNWVKFISRQKSNEKITTNHLFFQNPALQGGHRETPAEDGRAGTRRSGGRHQGGRGPRQNWPRYVFYEKIK